MTKPATWSAGLMPSNEKCHISTQNASAMIWWASRASCQSCRCKESHECSLTVNATLTDHRHFQDFAVLELVATFMCYPFQEDAEAAVSALLGGGWEFDITSRHSESRAHGRLWSLFTGKVPHHQEICCLLDCFIRRHVFMQVYLFLHEAHSV